MPHLATEPSAALSAAAFSEPPRTPSSVLVLGARGRFGSAAVHAFAAAGWTVHAQVRPGAPLPPAPAGVRWLAADPADTAALTRAAQGAELVVHALNPQYTRRAWEQQAPVLLAQTQACAQRLGATLVLPGNVYGFGAHMPALLREDSPQAPTTALGAVRVLLEGRLRDACAQGRLRALVLRAGDFYGGTGQGTWLERLAQDLPAGRLRWPGPLDVATPWAYLPDLARTLVQVATQREALGAFEVLHFPGHQATGRQWAEVLGQVAREQGWIAPQAALRTAPLPWPLLRVAALASPTLAAVHSMRYLWSTPHALDGTRLAARIGTAAHTPFEAAVRTALAPLLPRAAGAPALAA